MFKYLRISLVIVALFFAISTKAQNTPLTEPQQMYMQSNMFGISINSFNSRGVFYRYGWHKSGTQQNHFEVDISRIRHPKEVRRQGFTENPSQFSFGRMNVMYTLRTGFGRTTMITDRPYRNALGLNFVYSFGLSTAFLKPVYLDVFYPYDNNTTEGYLVSEKYDPEKHKDIYNIYGNSGFTKGISETRLVPGAYGKLGIQVEWGQYADEIRCLETGITLDAYSAGIPLMAHNPYERFFYGFYLAFNWGNRK